MSVGKNIKFYREVQKMNQDTLAKLTGFSLSSIQKYEAEIINVGDSLLPTFAAALCVPVEAFYDRRITEEVDAFLVLCDLVKSGYIALEGEKGIDGKYLEGGIRISFSNDLLRNMIMELAESVNEIKAITQASQTIKDNKLLRAMQYSVKIGEMKNSQMINEELESQYLSSHIFPLTEYPLHGCAQKFKTYSALISRMSGLLEHQILQDVVAMNDRGCKKRVFLTFEKNRFRELFFHHVEFCMWLSEFLIYFQDVDCEKKCFEYFDEEKGISLIRFVIFDETLSKGCKYLVDWNELRVPKLISYYVDVDQVVEYIEDHSEEANRIFKEQIKEFETEINYVN